MDVVELTPASHHLETRRPAIVDPSTWAGSAWLLGARELDGDVTFAVHSRRATTVMLEIYDRAVGGDASFECWMAKNPDDHIWRARLRNVPHGSLYGFRCWGPNWPHDPAWTRGGSKAGFLADVDGDGNRFNPNKVLHDPYARELSHDRETPMMRAAGEDGGMYGTGGGDYRGRPRREVDTGPWASKGLVIRRDDVSTGDRPHLPPERAAIYEAHVRGLTMHPSASRLREILADVPGFQDVPDVPEAVRGTYAGAALMAPYLKALGFTTIELLPVMETDNDANPEDRSGGNYWGYMTFGYFAPDRRYAADKSPGGPTREFKQMVAAFHAAGLEVYLDVVFNHTGEGGNWGDLETTGFTSFGGFDAPAYYQMSDEHWLVDGATGCGNQLNFSHEVTRDLVMDVLAYWIEEMGVDGFRFDLAPVLGRTPNAAEREDWDAQKRFFRSHPLLDDIRDLGQKHRVEMIAEAWDLWGYEVGNFPSGWGEWNGRYRDAARRFLKGDGNAPAFVEQMNGDWLAFNDQGGPQKSINFVCAHDGFTLADLVSYDTKNNGVEWPFGPSDGGSNSNESWSSGGDAALRRQRIRNVWVVQFFSRGVPMVVWGDEFGRTQNGNNNPYNVDSVATWSNYDMIATSRPQAASTGGAGAYHDNLGRAEGPKDRNPLFGFAATMARLRQAHPALRQRTYGDFGLDHGGDVTYRFHAPDGEGEVRQGERAVWLRIDGSAVGDVDFLLLVNMDAAPRDFAVPEAESRAWARIVDTAAWAEGEENVWSSVGGERILRHYRAEPWSVVVLQERREDAAGGAG